MGQSLGFDGDAAETLSAALRARPTEGAGAARAASAAAAPMRRIVFLGDSLVTGVGCAPDGGKGPALPRACAALIARALSVDVQWVAIGETGAVRALRSNSLSS